MEQLRADGDALVELVADRGGRVVGHILFSRLGLRGSHPSELAALGPMAVEPAGQRTGIGSALVREGIAACRDDGVRAIVVLGHSGFYPRFGFSAAAAAPLKAPFSGPAFMALELEADALASGGSLQYAAAFGLDRAS